LFFLRKNDFHLGRADIIDEDHFLDGEQNALVCKYRLWPSNGCQNLARPQKPAWDGAGGILVVGKREGYCWGDTAG